MVQLLNCTARLRSDRRLFCQSTPPQLSHAFTQIQRHGAGVPIPGLLFSAASVTPKVLIQWEIILGDSAVWSPHDPRPLVAMLPKNSLVPCLLSRYGSNT